MTEKQFARWGKRRAMGAVRFILLYGLLWSGAFIAIFYLAQVVVPRISSVKRLDSMFTLEGLVFFILVSLAGGPFVSGTVWYFHENAYLRHESANKGGRTLDV